MHLQGILSIDVRGPACIKCHNRFTAVPQVNIRICWSPRLAELLDRQTLPTFIPLSVCVLIVSTAHQANVSDEDHVLEVEQIIP